MGTPRGIAKLMSWACWSGTSGARGATTTRWRGCNSRSRAAARFRRRVRGGRICPIVAGTVGD
eukprot:3338741-Pyramimonas_sp.AAC.1